MTAIGGAIAVVLLSHIAMAGDSPPAASVADCSAQFVLDGSLGKNDEAQKALCDNLARVAASKDAVPVSPAFAAIGATPETVTRPRTPNEFATSLINNVDPNGNFKQGIALDFSPYMLWAGDEVTLRQYQDDYRVRFLARTQLSLATAKGKDSADKSSKVSIGLHFTPWLDQDPRGKESTLLTCMGNLMSAEIDSVGNPPPSTSSAAVQAAYIAKQDAAAQRAFASSEFEKCRDDFAKKADKTSGWTLGVAPMWVSRDSDLDDMDWGGLSAWSSLAYNLDGRTIPGLAGVPGFGDLGQAILHIRYNMDEEVPNPLRSGTFVEQDSFMLAGNWRFDGPSTMFSDRVKDAKFSIEGAFVDASRRNSTDDTYGQWTAGLQFHLPAISESIWVQLNAGTTSGKESKDSSFAGLSLKWGFDDTKAKSSATAQ